MIRAMTAGPPIRTIEIPADALVLLVGPAGSGKSTLAGRLFPAESVLSSDALRAEVSGDPANQAVSPLAFRILHNRAGQRLATGRLTVIDATNIAASARAPLRRLAREHRRPVVAIVLDLPAELSLARNAARAGRVVPESAVRRQQAALRLALDQGELTAEGLAAIVIVADPAEAEAMTIRLTKVARAATLSPSALPRRIRRRMP
jgi:protein phosphatase